MSHAKEFVIAGGGRAGRRTAENLTEKGQGVVLIEADPDRADELSDAYLGPVIQGDATRPSILEQAGLPMADAIAALTNDAATNLAICMEAQRLEPSIRTIARAETQSDEEYEQMVDATILPQYLGGDYAADMLTGGEVKTLLYPTSDLDILEVTVTESAPVAGRKLEEVALPQGSLLISTAERRELAGPDTILEAGDRYIIAVESDVTNEVLSLLRG